MNYMHPEEELQLCGIGGLTLICMSEKGGSHGLRGVPRAFRTGGFVVQRVKIRRDVEMFRIGGEYENVLNI